MAGSVNKCILIGHVGKPPEIRDLPGGDRVANFSLATGESWKDKKTGERKQTTDWHNVVVWGGLVEIVDRYVKKGSKLYLEGAYKTRMWEDNKGNKRWTSELVLQGFNSRLELLDSKSGGPPPAGSQDEYGTTSTNEGDYQVNQDPDDTAAYLTPEEKVKLSGEGWAT